jgi:sugar/nucleoside kinase (ribokinase family)
MTDHRFDIIGLGHACVDIVGHVDDAFLARWGVPKGDALEVDEARANAIEASMLDKGYFPGGASTNTAAVVAALGGHAGFVGKVADDAIGARIRADMQASGLSFLASTARADEGGSTRVICLTTAHPHPERSFAFYSGAGRSFRPEDLDARALARTRMLHADGHILTHPGAFATVFAAAELAKAAGATFAFTLADRTRMDEFPDLTARLIAKADIVLLNTPEAERVTGTRDLEHAVMGLRQMGKRGAITRGAEGCLVFSADDAHALPAAPVPGAVIDPNGAGDAFAGGFLYGLLAGLPLERAGVLGGRCAATVLTQLGARVRTDVKSALSGLDVPAV